MIIAELDEHVLTEAAEEGVDPFCNRQVVGPEVRRGEHLFPRFAMIGHGQCPALGSERQQAFGRKIGD
ncbi:hypothetical protein [Amycolatopsis sp. TNS106]|uniref:hypothetical protein n=1 Tax=Amycolatopsis sp. TNS106 TaxID=2861750 RepID=UPI002107B34E|nr:hypothetical protein [Amycolatopsis sp. TNS106]